VGVVEKWIVIFAQLERPSILSRLSCCRPVAVLLPWILIGWTKFSGNQSKCSPLLSPGPPQSVLDSLSNLPHTPHPHPPHRNGSQQGHRQAPSRQASAQDSQVQDRQAQDHRPVKADLPRVLHHQLWTVSIGPLPQVSQIQAQIFDLQNLFSPRFRVANKALI